ARGSHASYFDDEHLHIGDELAFDAPAERCEAIALDSSVGWMLWPGYWGGTRFMDHPRSPRGPQLCRSEWFDPAARHAEGVTRRERRREDRAHAATAVPRRPKPEGAEVALLAQADPSESPEKLEEQAKRRGLIDVEARRLDEIGTIEGGAP